MRLARGCALSSAACAAGDRLAAVFVRVLLPAAFVAAGFAVVPPGALGVAGFRFLDLLDWDLDAVLVLLVAMGPDMRIARLGATLWRSDPAARAPRAMSAPGPEIAPSTAASVALRLCLLFRHE